MIDRIFIDTNILVYLFDSGETIKHTKIKKVFAEKLKDSKLFISTQVVNEFINIVTRKISSPLQFEKLEEVINFFNDVFIISPINFHTIKKALSIKIDFNFSYWDSLIISSALENGCNFLFTEDLKDNLVIEEKLVISNPLK